VEADIQVKLMAVVRFCRLDPEMKKRGAHRIVNVTTVGWVPPPAPCPRP
jgi:NAD(P)-dependent dehydrogenase (short-subunit alcohol dehydrogenase family)